MTEPRALYATATDPLPWTCPHCGQVLGSIQNGGCDAMIESADGMPASVKWKVCPMCNETVVFTPNHLTT